METNLEQDTRDLSLTADQALLNVETGAQADVGFQAHYRGAVDAVTFDFLETSEIDGATITGPADPFTPATDSDTPLTVAVAVPPETPQGNYDVTLTAALQNGQERSASATLEVADRAFGRRTRNLIEMLETVEPV